jgi:hypothetical protein
MLMSDIASRSRRIAKCANGPAEPISALGAAAAIGDGPDEAGCNGPGSADCE